MEDRNRRSYYRAQFHSTAEVAKRGGEGSLSRLISETGYPRRSKESGRSHGEKEREQLIGKCVILLKRRRWGGSNQVPNCRSEAGEEKCSLSGNFSKRSTKKSRLLSRYIKIQRALATVRKKKGDCKRNTKRCLDTNKRVNDAVREGGIVHRPAREGGQKDLRKREPF